MAWDEGQECGGTRPARADEGGQHFCRFVGQQAGEGLLSLAASFKVNHNQLSAQAAILADV